MIIDITGFGWSGSGAVHDLLREYDDVHFASFEDFEFTLLWMVDGIADLEYKLCDKHCRCYDSEKAIQRFLDLTKKLECTKSFKYKEIFHGEFYSKCKEYIDDLTQIEFQARNFDDVMSSSIKEKWYKARKYVLGRVLCNRFVSPIVWKLFHRNIIPELVKANKHTIFLSYNPDNFIERTRLFITDLFSYLRVPSDERPIITDQFFPPDLPERFFNYVDETVRCIIVRRDPRDLYLLSKYAYHSDIMIPSNSVDDFILFYKKTIEEASNHNNESIMDINYEELVYNYDNTVERIESFLGIHSHTLKHRFFIPERSIHNTQLFNFYKNCNEDVEKIEVALPRSLFPFEKYSNKMSKRNYVY